MGDIKKFKKKYFTKPHPWNKKAIEEEAKLMQEFGFKNKREILIAATFLKKYKDLAKKLTATKTVQAGKEKQLIIIKLQKYGILPLGAELDQILALELKDVLNRRVQSIVYRKGFAKTIKQARQFIVHRHISIDNKEITAPAHFLTLEEEGKIMFKMTSAL